MPIVRITPPGRNARAFTLADVPRTWDIAGGCATASVPLALGPEDLERVLLARVDVFGERGLDWSGVVWRRPRNGEPIECAGQAVGLTLTPRACHYAHTQFLGDLKDWKNSGDRNDAAFERTNAGGKLVFTQRPGTTCATNDQAGLYLWGDIAWQRLTATVNKPHAKMSIEIRTGATEGADTTQRYISTAGTTGTAAIDISLGGDTSLVIKGLITAASTPSRSDTYAELYDITLWGTALTSITPYAVIDDCLDQLPSWILPAGAAYRAWVGSPAVTIGSLVFPGHDSTDKAKVDAVVAMADYHFGFYPRRVAGAMVGVPVYKAISRTPDYIVDVRCAVADNLRDRGAESLADNYRAMYRDEEDRPVIVDVPDSDSGNYLNRIGYTKTAIVDAGWTSSATVATAAATAAAAGYSDTEGAVTVLKALTATGRRCPASAIRPGDMCRVVGIGSPRSLVVRNVAASAAGVALTFAPVGTDLRYLTSKALGQAVVRY